VVTRPIGELLRAQERQKLLSLATPMSYGRGDTIFHEGEPTTYAVLIETGTVKMVRQRPDGRDMILAMRGPNDLIGEMAAIDRLPRSAGAVAMGPVKAHLIEADPFDAFLDQFPRVMRLLLAFMAARQRDTDQRRVEQASESVAHRVAGELVELAERQGDGDRTRAEEFVVSQTELAEVVGASREAVAKALSELRRKRLIETGRRFVRILDRDGLVELVGN
jgi:CRP-like cAMP-binding protein